MKTKRKTIGPGKKRFDRQGPVSTSRADRLRLKAWNFAEIANTGDKSLICLAVSRNL